MAWKCSSKTLETFYTAKLEVRFSVKLIPILLKEEENIYFICMYVFIAYYICIFTATFSPCLEENIYLIADKKGIIRSILFVR